MRVSLHIALVAMLMLLPGIATANPDERFALARSLLADGEYEQALAEFSTLRNEYPHNVDYAFGRGQALARLGRDAEALEELDKAIALAPAYEDVWRERFNVLARRQDNHYSDELDAFRTRAAARFPSSRWWRTANPEERGPWLLTIGAGLDTLSNGLPGWDNQFAELHFERNEHQRYAMRLSRDARGSTSDVSTALRGDFSLPSGWYAGASMSVAASPVYAPKASANLHVGRPVADGWSATLHYRYRDYSSATVSSLVGGVEYYFSDYRVAYELTASRLHGASSFNNHVVTGNWFYRDESSVGVTVSTGREAESIGAGQVLETDVRSITLAGRHQLTGRIGLQWWAGVHEQGDFYRRRFLGMAVSIGL